MWGYPFTIITDRENKIIKTIQAKDYSDNFPQAAMEEIELTLDKYLHQ